MAQEELKDGVIEKQDEQAREVSEQLNNVIEQAAHGNQEGIIEEVKHEEPDAARQEDNEEDVRNLVDKEEQEW